MPPKKNHKKNVDKVQRALVEKDDQTEYGLVTKKLGDGRFTVRLNMQNKEVVGRLRGKFRHGASKHTNRVDIDTVVLVGIRDYQDNIVDIIHVYDASEVRQLKKSGAFVEESVRNTEDKDDLPQDDDDGGFDFSEI